MNIDTGLAIVILSILIFYLRLIILQRERAKRSAALLAAQRRAGNLQGKGKKNAVPQRVPGYSILTKNRRNWVIAGIGAAAILVGLLVNAGLVLISFQTYWWAPVAAGIVAFSWAFSLDEGDERA